MANDFYRCAEGRGQIAGPKMGPMRKVVLAVIRGSRLEPLQNIRLIEHDVAALGMLVRKWHSFVLNQSAVNYPLLSKQHITNIYPSAPFA